MQVFVVFQVLIVLTLVTIHLMVHFWLDYRSFLGCTPDGFEWVYLTVEGSLFLLMHMGCIFMQAVMMEKVFYGVPKNMGYYEDAYDDDEVDSEPPSPVFSKRKLRLS